MLHVGRSMHGALVCLVACGGADAHRTGGDAASGDSSAAAGTADDAAGTNATTTAAMPASSGTTGDASTAAVDDTAAGSTGGTASDSGADDSTTGIGGEANVLYVRDDGQDSNPGTIEAPMRTIQWAIGQASAQGGIDTIRVAEGDYGFDYANDAQIVIADGVSLVGGYRADWGARDPVTYVSRIVDESATAIGSTEDAPHRAIEVPASVGAGTVIDGFHVEIATGQYRAALLVAGDVTVRNSVLAPVADDTQVSAYGLRVLDADPIVYANRLAFDVVASEGLSYAVSAENSDGTFTNNLVDLSGLEGYGYGFYFAGGSPTLLANSIWITAGINMTGIWLVGATPTIENNLIEAEGQSNVCIWSSGGASVPTSLRNNVLDCYYTMFGSDPLRSWTTIMEVETGLAGAADNVKLPGLLTSPAVDMALDEDAPCTVTLGGRDLGAMVPDDFDGLPRTAPPSIGAREWDGACQ